MNNKELLALQKSTKLMVKAMKTDISAIEKVDILAQLLENLKILKESMDRKEYDEEFGKLEKQVYKVIEDISNPTFMDKFIKKINDFLLQYS